MLNTTFHVLSLGRLDDIDEYCNMPKTPQYPNHIDLHGLGIYSAELLSVTTMPTTTTRRVESGMLYCVVYVRTYIHDKNMMHMFF